MVFSFSSHNAEKSSGLSMKIAQIFTNNESILHIVESVIRKIAHLSEYTMRWIFILWVIFNL